MVSKDKLATKQESTLANPNAIPEYLRKQDGEGIIGLEGMERTDMKVPRLALCQAMTPQRSKTSPKFIPELREGEFFNSITGKNFGEKLRFVPLLWWKSRLLFVPMDEGGGLLCRSDNAIVGVGDPGGRCIACPKSQWRTGGPGEKRRPPECSLLHNYAALVLGDDHMPTPEDMLVISMKSTGLDAATDLNALMQLRGAKATWAGIYELSSAADSNAAGQDYFIPVVKNAGWVSKELADIAEGVYRSVNSLKQAGKLEVDHIEGEVVQEEPGEKEL